MPSAEVWAHSTTRKKSRTWKKSCLEGERAENQHHLTSLYLSRTGKREGGTSETSAMGQIALLIWCSVEKAALSVPCYLLGHLPGTQRACCRALPSPLGFPVVWRDSEIPPPPEKGWSNCWVLVGRELKGTTERWGAILLPRPLEMTSFALENMKITATT